MLALARMLKEATPCEWPPIDVGETYVNCSYFTVTNSTCLVVFRLAEEYAGGTSDAEVPLIRT